ncbi:MAG: hypothetical protein GDA43_15455 [Hormoscilla sp. SP5CHS1]|nr:hypothetical protein [Hormoscilla sp. SP5CHS1]MBC6473600.1 hypothetical protein [Hormoscilla sp. GM102CHS1]
MQLLEGVHFGWGQVQVLNYLDNLSDFSGRPRTDRASKLRVGWVESA